MEVQSIQEMVKNSINEIPTRYLVDQESVDKNSPPAAIPVLDMKSLLSEEGKTFQLEKLHSVCTDWGIFQLVNHGVDFSVVEKLKYEIQEFYELPLEERLRYKIRPGDVEGYGQTIILSPDQKVDWADRFYLLTNPIHRRKPHLLPELPSSFRETLEAYISELQKLARTIFELIAKALKIERIEVEEIFENGMQSVRMTYYPPCPQPNKVIGLTPHSDASGITILLQVNGVGGFQVKKDGIWMPVEILPDAFVVNLGDIIEILSNGLYKSIEHRATVNSEKERITTAMFFNPKFEAQVGPSRSIVVNQPPLFRCMKTEQYFKDFCSRKLNGKSFLDYMKIQN
ncbi:Iron/ascorbate family oxidoreductase [Handroanthus impetiginosus]|uniref:Iron/ascorbate family oxidoreductase n=1 Tax=Handroanthus impetiginosus TaxID=429701 RepID=A0A2G9G059_9LAMI|nr:Iron/ascorbate family oxidoreductase [Handroanthus impetiginosus]